jgi:3-isopropylmalate dehydrogenase
LSAGLLLRYSLDLTVEADAVDKAVDAVIAAGGRTGDIARTGEAVLSTREMGDAILSQI